MGSDETTMPDLRVNGPQSTSMRSNGDGACRIAAPQLSATAAAGTKDGVAGTVQDGCALPPPPPSLQMQQHKQPCHQQQQQQQQQQHRQQRTLVGSASFATASSYPSLASLAGSGGGHHPATLSHPSLSSLAPPTSPPKPTEQRYLMSDGTNHSHSAPPPSRDPPDAVRCVVCGFAGSDLRIKGCACAYHASCLHCNGAARGLLILPLSFTEMDWAQRAASAT